MSFKSIVLTALLAATGVVESVREVPLAEDPAAFPGVLEHAYKPRTGEEILVRLDDGRAIAVVQTGMQIFQPGQRVFVVPGGKRPRVEHADEPLSFQP